MIYGSVCSGIEAATVAWQPLGWKPAWFSEIDPFCCELLKHHYPTVINHGDFTEIGTDSSPIDLLCGGTPCQDFSVAGLRAGLAGARGNLTLEFVELAGRLRPRWLVWENVPGVLSIDTGRACGAFLSGLAELGYGFAYRVLDAQYFGVPQRRRRVFVVGYLGDWRCAAAVLFERHSLSGHPPPSREAREDVTHETCGSLTGSGRGVERPGESRGQDPVIAVSLSSHHGRNDLDSMTFVPDVCPTLRSGGNQTGGDRPPGTDVDTCDSLVAFVPDVAYGLNAHPSRRYDAQANETFIAFDTTQITSATNRSNPQPGDPCHSLAKGTHAPAIAYPILEAGARTGKSTTDPRAGIGSGDAGDPMYTLQSGKQHAVGVSLRGDGFDASEDGTGRGTPLVLGFQSSQSGMREVETHATLDAHNGSRRHNGVVQGIAVRRLTPRECERLQGFPDDYTLIPRKGGKLAADGPRYKAIGNSWPVPVITWIGRRIQMVDDMVTAGGERIQAVEDLIASRAIERAA